jgi:hypothetical protein
MAENEVSVRKNIDTETGEIVSENFLTPSEAFSSNSSLSNYFTTDPTEGLAAQAENLNALSSSDAKPLSDATNMTLKIVKFVANNVRMNDRQTGEDATFLRVVIITDAGKMYSTVSDSVKRVLGQFYNLFSHAGLKFSKETPFVAKVTLSDTKSGNKALGLQADVKAIASYDKKSAAK